MLTLSHATCLCLTVLPSGFLTDLVQVKAMERGAAYLLCPCCIGNLKQSVELALQRAGGGEGVMKPSRTIKKSEWLMHQGAGSCTSVGSHTAPPHLVVCLCRPPSLPVYTGLSTAQLYESRFQNVRTWLCLP